MTKCHAGGTRGAIYYDTQLRLRESGIGKPCFIAQRAIDGHANASGIMETGVIEPIRYVCAHDVGLIVNPDTLPHVIDRQLVYGTSRTMFEELRFDENMVTSIDWETYPVLHADFQLPQIDVVLVDRPEEAPSGGAEMALGLVPAAIGNAVFDATGVRLRRVPFTPERVKSALEKA